MQFSHASAHYTSKNWELHRILMITYDFNLAMTKEFWAVFLNFFTAKGQEEIRCSFGFSFLESPKVGSYSKNNVKNLS